MDVQRELMRVKVTQKDYLFIREQLRKTEEKRLLLVREIKHLKNGHAALKKEAASLRSDRTQLNNYFRAAEEQARILEEQNKELTNLVKVQSEKAKIVVDILAGCGFAENKDSKENYQLVKEALNSIMMKGDTADVLEGSGHEKMHEN